MNEHIEIYGDDSDLYIASSDVKVGIEFIKSQDIEFNVSKSIIDNIASMEKQVADLKEFIGQFNIKKDNKRTM